MNDEQGNVKNVGSVYMRSLCVHSHSCVLTVLDTFFGNSLSASAEAQLK